ncbi:hypothetical protein EVAR_17798_1 [Eumeta japonica]|uniref:Uncharacterized protein n=1 Tax=Eumeta variegata TaxID=151549 RepID=A0A4C1TTH6_EUMVA|nr:hypothetical protein EVAR_17798_1 [Eumeta japonica]
MYAEGKEKHRLAERLAANVHLSWSPAHIRGEIHMDVGVIASRNALSALPAAALRAQLPRLLAGPAPFVRLALTLALDRLLPFDVLKIVAQLRHGHNTQIKQFLLKRFYKYISVKCDNIPPEVWQEFKALMIEMIPHYSIKLWSLICDVDAIANAFKMEYCMTIVRITSSENFKLNKVKGLVQTFKYINDNIEKASKDKILDILQNFLKNDFHSLNFITLCEDYDFDCLVRIKITILVRFLLTCETEKVQREALDNVAKPFLHTVGASWHDKLIRECFELFLYGLKYNKAYLDMRYVSNTPVFEVILTFMRTFLDVKEYFHLYSRIHLTMIYRETLKRLQERHPNVLAEPAGKTEAAAAVGAVLAGYLAREHRQLRVHYFPAITDIYARELCYYIKHYGFGSGAVSRKFEISLVRGLIANDDDEDVYLAAVLFFCLQWHQTSYLKDPDIRKILTLFENNYGAGKSFETRAHDRNRQRDKSAPRQHLNPVADRDRIPCLTPVRLGHGRETDIMVDSCLSWVTQDAGVSMRSSCETWKNHVTWLVLDGCSAVPDGDHGYHDTRNFINGLESGTGCK